MKKHLPVLLPEVLASLSPKPNESYLDLTAGYGGHAKAILDVTRNYKNAYLVDRDAEACEYLKHKFQRGPSSEAIHIVHSDFCSAVLQFLECGDTFDLILADFGVSSPQLDEEKRGFSFQKNGPLDMRMDPSQALTAADVVNRYPLSALADIFIKYGEQSPRRAEQLALAIVKHRPLETTHQLTELVLAHSRSSRTHPAAPIFQAIRIEVNDELGEIERTLPLLPQLLNPSGRVALITFHSLEDRLVKTFFKEQASLGEESTLTPLTKKPIVADQVELVINPRARSAKLRVAVRN